MDITDIIRTKLLTLQPHHLEVQDESSKHAGHSGHKPGQVTHIRITVTSDQFKGKTPLQRHQQIYQLLASEILQLHAIQLSLKLPE